MISRRAPFVAGLELSDALKDRGSVIANLIDTFTHGMPGLAFDYVVVGASSLVGLKHGEAGRYQYLRWPITTLWTLLALPPVHRKIPIFNAAARLAWRVLRRQITCSGPVTAPWSPQT